MYFSEISLRKTAFRRPDIWRFLKSPYGLHKALWTFFDDHPKRTRDFLFRLHSNRPEPMIYCVSKREPQADEDIWSLRVQDYTPQLNTGMQLAFVLRANPVIKKRSSANRQIRHDVVMELKKNLRENKALRDQLPSMTEIAHRAGTKWLGERSEKNGFSIQEKEIHVDGYSPAKFMKPGQKNPVSFSSLDFSGQLKITDPDLFKEVLYKGIGPSKGFGCGLMLIRKIR